MSAVHVVLIASWYKSERYPVLGSFFEEQARALAGQGARTAILHPVLHSFRARFSPDRETPPPDVVDDGLPTLRPHAWSLLPSAPALNYWWLERAALRALERHVATHGMPDLLHAHSTFDGGIVAAGLARRTGLPLVFTEHLSAIIDPSWPPDPASADRLRDVFARADRPLAVSSALRDALARFNIDTTRVEVVPNIVAPEFFANVGPPPAGPRFTCFTVSYLIPRKRVDLLLRAFALASRRQPQLELRIGGDGSERPRLEALAQELGIADRVSFLGLLPRARVREELGRSHAFVLASAFETFGVVVAEALAAGRPVVVTDSGGVRDVVAEGDGLLVRDADPESLASALEALVARRSEIDPQELSRRCHARFAPESVARRLLAIYDEVLAHRSSARR